MGSGTATQSSGMVHEGAQRQAKLRSELNPGWHCAVREFQSSVADGWVLAPQQSRVYLVKLLAFSSLARGSFACCQVQAPSPACRSQQELWLTAFWVSSDDWP